MQFGLYGPASAWLDVVWHCYCAKVTARILLIVIPAAKFDHATFPRGCRHKVVFLRE